MFLLLYAITYHPDASKIKFFRSFAPEPSLGLHHGPAVKLTVQNLTFKTQFYAKTDISKTAWINPWTHKLP